MVQDRHMVSGHKGPLTENRWWRIEWLHDWRR